MQGVKQRETGKVMMEQERRCWAQHREEVRGHLVTVYQERSAQGWGVAGTEGVLGECDGISQAAHRRTVCVGTHVCIHVCVCVCVCPCGHC